MSDHTQDSTAPLMRPPEHVMRLERIGAFHQSRLSFVRSLVRQMNRSDWTIEQTESTLDQDGYGHIIYRVSTPSRVLDFVAFSTPLPAEERSDRVIAERWDSSFALIDGPATPTLISHLSEHVPRQEQGRMNASVVVLSRANRSVRLFNHVIDCLKNGLQPDIEALAKTGYLMRTTAVYGNGKFGLADFAGIKDETLGASFRLQMLAVYLVRLFSFDLVNHIAKQANPDLAVGLARPLRRYLGIGNATGLGMAPFLVSHPALINQWIAQRERALALVHGESSADPIRCERFLTLLARARNHYSEFTTSDSIQQARYDAMLENLARLTNEAPRLIGAPRPWINLAAFADEHYCIETQELINSLVLELYPEHCDELAEAMNADEANDVDGGMSLQRLSDIIEKYYAWAFDPDLSAKEQQDVFWYRSEVKEEPRLGRRDQEAGAELELDIGVGREIATLHRHLASESLAPLTRQSLVAEFVLRNPERRGLIRRIQSVEHAPYGEIRDNLLGADCRPIDLLRCKLSFFGASRFDPKSNLWTRITLFQGAPLADELSDANADDWSFPVKPPGA